MRFFIYFALLLSLLECKSDSVKEIKIPQVGLTLRIPVNSDFWTHLQIDSVQEIGYWPTRELFSIRNNPNNHIICLAHIFDSTRFGGSWEESYANDNSIMFELLYDNPRTKVLDTASYVELISDLLFNKLSFKVYFPITKTTVYYYFYSRKLKYYNFSINIVFSDKRIGRRYFNILKNLRFDE